jgi:aryl-alcohol dehydrogenase-like predicted oxidoreductase
MKYTTLGSTGLVVSKFCFGSTILGDGREPFRSISSVGQTRADELVAMSIDGGINFFDPAENDTEGENEIILGQSLKNLKVARGDVVIATKIYCRGGPGQNDSGAPRSQIRDAVEASLRRLQTDYIDLYQIRATELVFPLEETLRALDTLVTQGKVRYTGCYNWPAWKIAEALGISELGNLAQFVSVQACYSIAGRDLEREIIPLLESEKVGLLVGNPLASGLLSRKFTHSPQIIADSRRANFDFPVVDNVPTWVRIWKILNVMVTIAKAHKCSPARLSLAWLLVKPFVSSIIIGARRHEQLQDSLAAAELTLTRDELRQLDEVSAVAPEHPGWGAAAPRR